MPSLCDIKSIPLGSFLQSRGSVVKGQLSLEKNLRLPEVFPSFQTMGRYGSHDYCAHPENRIPLPPQKGDPDGSSDMSQIHRSSFTREAPDFHTRLLKEHPNSTVMSAISFGSRSFAG